MVTSSYKLIHLLDVTSLGDADDESTIRQLCTDASGLGDGPVAAVCVYPQFVALAKSCLPDTIKVATVINFPSGTQTDSCEQIAAALDAGADEIDWVLPYQAFLQGEDVLSDIRAVRKACKDHCLKVILESGAYPNTDLIAAASNLCITANVDFIKTSTGKINIGATLPAAKAILSAIKQSGSHTGIKLSGGIRTQQAAKEYLTLIESVMGADWITPNHVRFGCSKVPSDVEANQ